MNEGRTHVCKEKLRGVYRIVVKMARHGMGNEKKLHSRVMDCLRHHVHVEQIFVLPIGVYSLIYISADLYRPETTYPFQPQTLLHFHGPCLPLCGDSDLDFDTSLDVDDDLLDNLGGGVEIDETYQNH